MTARSSSSRKADRRRGAAGSSARRASPSSTRPRASTNSKRTKAKRPKPRKPSSRKTKSIPSKQLPKRKRYNSLGQHEVMYQAWVTDGTVAGAVWRLRAVEGFEDLDERTLGSVRDEKRGTDADWDERAKRFYIQLAARIDSETAEVVARLRASTQKKLLGALEKLADAADEKLAPAARRILSDIADAEMSHQDRIYGFSKALRELVQALRPPEKSGASVSIDNRRQFLAVTSPREIAKAATQKTLDLEVARKERSVELDRV